jgi:hypothetical protein
VTPLSGSSGEEITITVAPTGLAPGTYGANIRVLAGAYGIENGDQTIAVTLRIVEQVYSSWLPLVSRP